MVPAAAGLNVPRKTLYDKLTRFSVDPSSFRAETVSASLQPTFGALVH